METSGERAGNLLLLKQFMNLPYFRGSTTSGKAIFIRGRREAAYFCTTAPYAHSGDTPQIETPTPQQSQGRMLPPPFGVADTPEGLRGPHDGAFPQGKSPWSTGQSREHRLLTPIPKGLWPSPLRAGRAAARMDGQTDRHTAPTSLHALNRTQDTLHPLSAAAFSRKLSQNPFFPFLPFPRRIRSRKGVVYPTSRTPSQDKPPLPAPHRYLLCPPGGKAAPQREQTRPRLSPADFRLSSCHHLVVFPGGSRASQKNHHLPNFSHLGTPAWQSCSLGFGLQVTLQSPRRVQTPFPSWQVSVRLSTTNYFACRSFGLLFLSQIGSWFLLVSRVC